MTPLFTKHQTSQNQPKFKTTKEILENLYLQKAKHEKQFFDYEKELEGIQFRILEIREHQKHHKEKVFALEKEIAKYNKPKPIKPKYNYTSFYIFAGLLIAIFIASLYFLFTHFIAV
ncbi:hypothetical protein [Bernardetia sp.]|uniref:hypothetical protein n=1 Tax=Bernardetia sp. TaxID=1937974 RepID=UPI0025B8450A|nr:hypothetical protein [Bernardetia sp.]